jgi:DNA-binding NarL/FixJ family response regulator
MKKPLRILLVDDHVLFRKGIAALLHARSDMTVVGEADNGLEAMERVPEVAPEVILMDIDMPECNGLEATKFIKAERPDVQIIMLTVSDNDENLFEAIKNGASGYLLKDLEPYQFITMLKSLQAGEAPISGLMATKILQKFKEADADQEQEEAAVDALTPREIEVLEQVVAGATNKEIAETLVITENTVKIHLRNILEKLHLQNRVQAAVYAVREGLVEDEADETEPDP